MVPWDWSLFLDIFSLGLALVPRNICFYYPTSGFTISVTKTLKKVEQTIHIKENKSKIEQFIKKTTYNIVKTGKMHSYTLISQI